MKRGSLLGSLFVLAIFFALAGCSNKAGVEVVKPKVIHYKFLLFEEKSVSDKSSIGDLYVLMEGKASEKIASNVIDGQFQYNDNKDEIFYKNNENALYMYDKTNEKVKLAKDVLTYNTNYSDDIVTYLNQDSDLYIIQGKGDPEKIASSVRQYDVIGGYVYYINHHNELSMYEVKTKQETSIASDVTYFTNLNGQDEIAYLNSDSELYVKKANQKDSIKISTEAVSPEGIKIIGDQIVYLNIDDKESTILYTAPIKEGTAPQKIANDVTTYKYNNGYYYYVNTDGILYKKKESDTTSTRIASDITNFSLQDHTLIYLNKDKNLYKQTDGNEPKKIASSVDDYHTTSKGDIFYRTQDHELFLNNTKIASDISQYSFYFDNVAFATKDGKLYLMKNLGEKKVLEDNLRKYSNAFYQNQNVYMNHLTFEDIAGVWKNEAAGYFVEIDKNGNFTNLKSNLAEKYEQDYSSGYHTITAHSKNNSFKIELGKDQTLTFNTTIDGSIPLTKSSKEEAAAYYKNQQVQADKTEITGLINGYVTNFANAVNFGAVYEISNYMVPDSAFYNQQAQYVQDAYSKSIYERLVDYKIEGINNINDNEYSVKVQEIYNISIGVFGDSQKKSFVNTYNVKRVDGKLLINGISVSQ